MNASPVHLVLAAAVVVLLLVIGALALRVGPFAPSTGLSAANGDTNSVGSASVRLVLVVDPSCTQCVSLDGVEAALSDQNITVRDSQSLDWRSAQGAAFVSEYDLNRVPAIIMLANRAAVPLLSVGFAPRSVLETGETVFVYDDTPPVFVETATGKTRGIVDATVIVDSNCTQCRAAPGTDEVSQLGVTVGAYRVVERASEDGKSLIARYLLHRLPAIVFSSEIAVYADVVSAISSRGTVEPDGAFVFREYPPVYLDLDLNRPVGLTRLALLNDSACATCYDVNVHLSVLSVAFGVEPFGIERLDTSTPLGRRFASDHNVHVVPTFVLSGDVNAYPELMRSWSNLGSVASDGALVFSRFDAMGADLNVFDLDQNQVVLVRGGVSS